MYNTTLISLNFKINFVPVLQANARTTDHLIKKDIHEKQS